uniref:Uncharacterized protein n=1 Tax=Anguilla anguilla TaxID=7936 RepID=A0A0E9Q4H4_ANGAN
MRISGTVKLFVEGMHSCDHLFKF